MQAVKTLRREMSAHPEEYLRELRLAFPGAVSVDGDVACARTPEASVEAVLRVGAPRRIANLTLPTLHVTLHFAGDSDDACARLLAHMDRAMHRGGG